MQKCRILTSEVKEFFEKERSFIQKDPFFNSQLKNMIDVNKRRLIIYFFILGAFASSIQAIFLMPSEFTTIGTIALLSLLIILSGIGAIFFVFLAYFLAYGILKVLILIPFQEYFYLRQQVEKKLISLEEGLGPVNTKLSVIEQSFKRV